MQYSDARDILEKHGFDWLTGESCAISLRILFDVNAEARGILNRFFGATVTGKPAYNHDSAWQSLKLSYSTIDDLCTFILSETGYPVIYADNPKTSFTRRVWIVCDNEDENENEDVGLLADRLLNIYNYVRVFRTYSQQPRRGLDNIHGWTGRW